MAALTANPLREDDRAEGARRQDGRRGRIAAMAALGISSAVAGIAIGAYWGLGGLRADVGLGPLATVPIERLVAMLDRATGEIGLIPAPTSEPAAVVSGPAGMARSPEPWGKDVPSPHQERSMAPPEPRLEPVAVTAAQPEPTGSASEPPAATTPEPRAEDIRQPAAEVAPTLAPPAGSTEDEMPDPAAEPEAPSEMVLALAPAADRDTLPAETEDPPPADLAGAPDPSATTMPAPPEIVSPPQTLEPLPETAAPAVASAAPTDAPATSGDPPPAAPMASAGVSIRSVAAAPGPAVPAVDAPALQRMIARGDALLSARDVVSARLLYELAASRGSPAAATMAGKSYDPFFLAEANIHGAPADPAKAVEWYRKAITGGDSDAFSRLQRLNRRLGQ